MALAAEALLSPTGRLQAAVLWPGVSGDDVTAKLEAFLLEAVAKTTAITDATDAAEAQRQWAYYRAFDEVYQRLVSLPSTVEFRDEGSGSYLVTQMSLMQELRDQALAAFTGLLDAADEDSAPAAPVRTASHQSAIRFTW